MARARSVSPTGSTGPGRLLGVAWAASLAVCLLLFLEWLFLVTKPSMFTVIGWPQRVAVLLAAALITAIPVACVAVLLGWAGSRLGGRWRGRGAAVGLAVPAAVLSAAGLLALENFTKTVFGFNIASFASPIRYLYAVGWLLLALWAHRSMTGWLAAAAGRRRRSPLSGPLRLALALLVAASLLATVVRYEPLWAADSLGVRDKSELPNILILSSDGLNATNMSFYGHQRPTTPFLDSLSDDFLVSENHFTNSTMTTAAVGALLSGKLPTRTGVLRGGYVFQGEDVFQHLPGILRQLGYYNIDVSARVWGDSYDMNMRQGFHVANGRSLANESLPVLRWIVRSYPSETYFVSLTFERLSERLLHVLGLVDMKDSFDLVAKRETPSMRDAERVQMLEEEIGRAPRPFFAQVHLYDTHRVPQPDRGPLEPRNRFIVARPFFSANPEATPEDRYDDTILGFDDFVEEILGRLEASGELDSTLLVINSDHGERRQAHVRLPLLIRFPNGEHRGRIVANTQRIDIAPTILAYLGLEPPDWMAGQSLIGGEPDPLRSIVVTGEGDKPTDRWLSIVQCQRSFAFHVRSTLMHRYEVDRHTAPCAEEDLLEDAAARRQLFAHLDISGVLAVPFGMQLASLRLDNNPEMRRHAARSIRRGQVPVLWLGETIAITRAHASFWTDGTAPAAVLLRNDGEEPRTDQLLVTSGERREFPAGFSVQDGQGTRDFSFSGPGSISVALGETAPGSERLFLVWSDRVWRSPDGGPQLGVRLSLDAVWLGELLRRNRPEEWRQAAAMLFADSVPARALGEDCLATNLHPDRWTRGREPAGLAIRNPGNAPQGRRLMVQSGSEHRFPLRIHLHDGSRSHAYQFEKPGSLAVDLPELPASSERLFILWSESGVTPTGARREIGVRLALEPAA